LALLQRWLGELLQQRAGGSGDALQRRPALQPPGTETAETREERERRDRERDGGAHGWIGSNRIGSGAKRAVHVPCKRKTVKKFAKSRRRRNLPFNVKTSEAHEFEVKYRNFSL